MNIVATSNIRVIYTLSYLHDLEFGIIFFWLIQNDLNIETHHYD